MNSTSIGIELVNAGWTQGADGGRVWHAYDDRQIRALTILVRDPIQRHGVAPENVVGHSDIAPQRRDPGPLFPWKQLAAAGIGRWYDEAGAAAQLARLQVEPLPAPAWFQQQLQRLATPARKRARWTAPPSTCWRPSRCITARRATTANPTLKPRQS